MRLLWFGCACPSVRSYEGIGHAACGVDLRLMLLDSGEIRGGFEHAYEARIVPTPDSPVLRSIEHATGVDRAKAVHIEVQVDDGTTWSRTFEGGFKASSPSCIFTTPNPYVLGVRVQGVCYVVDVMHPSETRELPVLPLECSASDISSGRLFLADDFTVIGFDGVRVLWESRRVSLDGIRDLTYVDGLVRGIATDVGLDNVPFAINPLNGDAEGGFEGFRVL